MNKIILSNLITYFSFKPLKDKRLVLAATLLLAAAYYRSQTSNTYAYAIRCGLTTATKLFFSTFRIANPDYGTQFNKGMLLPCLETIIAGKPVTIVDATAYDDTVTFKTPIVMTTLVDGMVGNHMTIFYIEMKNRFLNVEFYDGKALPIDHPLNNRAKHIYDQLKTKHPDLVFKQLTKIFQFDAHNCGPYSCWFIDQRLQHTFEQVEALPRPDIEAYRSQLLKK